MFNALGEIVIVRCETAGLIVLAGPNKRSELETVVQLMEEFDCSNIFIDGSLNRIAPMSVVDKIIFTTGAARTTDIPALVEKMNSPISVIPRSPDPNGVLHGAGTTRNLAFPAGISTATIIDKPEVERILQQCKTDCHTGERLYPVIINGLITSTGLQTLVERIPLLPDADRLHEIIFNNPISLLLSGEPQHTAQHIAQLTGLGITISYQNQSISPP